MNPGNAQFLNWNPGSGTGDGDGDGDVPAAAAAAASDFASFPAANVIAADLDFLLELFGSLSPSLRAVAGPGGNLHQHPPADGGVGGGGGGPPTQEEGDERNEQLRRKRRRYRSSELHNLTERRRRDRINEKLKTLQALIPNAHRMDKACLLDEAVAYIKSLQQHVQILATSGNHLYAAGVGPQPPQPLAGLPHGLSVFPAAAEAAAALNLGVGLMPPAPPVPPSYHVPNRSTIIPPPPSPPPRFPSHTSLMMSQLQTPPPSPAAMRCYYPYINYDSEDHPLESQPPPPPPLAASSQAVQEFFQLVDQAGPSSLQQ